MNVTSVQIAAFAAAVLPALVIVAYFLIGARIRIDADSVWAGFGFGACTTFPVIVFSGVLTTASGPGEGFYEVTAVKAFLGAAVPEEIFKFIGLIALCWGRFRELRPNHVFAISVAVAGGFACLENILYVLSGDAWHATALIRSVSAVPGHAFVGAIMGLCAVRAVRSPLAILWWICALVLPIALHGAYDFFLFGLVDIRAGELGAPQDMAQVFVILFVATVLIEGALAHMSLRSILGMEDSWSDDLRYSDRPVLPVRWLLALSESPVSWGVLGILCLVGAVVLFLAPFFGTVEGNAITNEARRAIVFGFSVFCALHGFAFLGLSYSIRRGFTFQFFARPFH